MVLKIVKYLTFSVNIKKKKLLHPISNFQSISSFEKQCSIGLKEQFNQERS